MAQETKEISVIGSCGASIGSLENLAKAETDQGIQSSAATPRLAVAPAIFIGDVTKDCQPSDIVDVDLPILPAQAHLRPNSLRIMQSSLEASRCSEWPTIAESKITETYKGDQRKQKTDRAAEQGYSAEWSGGYSRRGCLQFEAAMGDQFTTRKNPTWRGEEQYGGGDYCDAHSTGCQDSTGSNTSWGRRCNQTSSTPQRTQGGFGSSSCRTGRQTRSMRRQAKGKNLVPRSPQPAWKIEQAIEVADGQDPICGRGMAEVCETSCRQVRGTSKDVSLQSGIFDERVLGQGARASASEARSPARLPALVCRSTSSAPFRHSGRNCNDDAAGVAGRCNVWRGSVRRVSGRNSSHHLGRRRVDGGSNSCQIIDQVGGAAVCKESGSISYQSGTIAPEDEGDRKGQSVTHPEVMMTLSDFAGDPQAIHGLLDSGPMFDGGSPSVDGVCDDVGNYQEDSCMIWAKEVAQLGPLVHHGSSSRLITDDPPCPCDRWCGESDGESLEGDFRSCLKPGSSQGLKPKSVSFESTIDVFGFDPASPADAFPEAWWVDVVVPPTSQRASPGVLENLAVPRDPYFEFWNEWCRFWQPVQQIIDSNGPVQPGDGCSGRFGDSFNGSSGHGVLKKEHRNEGGLAVGHPDPRLIDPRAYIPEVPEDRDSDDDLGVEFHRWSDVIRLTDLHPYRREGSIPFITYGLRLHHLGRRDFSSPDLLPGRIKELIWNLWQNEVGRFEQVVIHFIRPQPVRELGAEGVIVLLIEILCDDIPPGSSPALAVTCDTSHRLMDSPKALYVDRAVDVSLLMPHFGLSYLCAPRGFRQCTFTVASALIGAYFVPVPEGALIKLMVGAKLRIFAQAFLWFPDLERFAAVVREQVRLGTQDHEMVFHCKDAPPKRFGFRIGQLLAPPQLRVSLQQLCGKEIKACYPVDHDALNAMMGGTCTSFHALLYLQGQPLDHAFLVVTGGDSQQREAHGRRVVVCQRDSFSGLEALHLHLNGGNSVARDETFTFLYEGNPVLDLHAIPFGSVILHSVAHATDGDVSLDGEETAGEFEDFGDEEALSEDDLSLLQLQAGSRYITILQDGHPPLEIAVQHDEEDIERCAIVNQLPTRFADICEWGDRCHVRCDTGFRLVELLMDPRRSDGRCDVIADCMWIGGNGGPSYAAVVLRVTSPCTQHDAVHAVCRQVGCKEVQVEQLWIHGARWEQDVPCPVENGDVCRVQIRAVEDRLGSSCQPDVLEETRCVTKPPIFTFVGDVEGIYRRFDVVACDETQARAQIEKVFEDQVQITLIR